MSSKTVEVLTLTEVAAARLLAVEPDSRRGVGGNRTSSPSVMDSSAKRAKFEVKSLAILRL